MKRDSENNRLDRQIDNLTDSLRDQGLAPGRDLWPGIDEAIGRTEQASRGALRAGWLSGWRMAALAASLALIIGVGYVGTTGDGSLEAYRAGTEQDINLAYSPGNIAAADNPSALQRLDRSLGELNEALIKDPENRNLSRLVLLVHKSRANIMRKNSQFMAR